MTVRKSSALKREAIAKGDVIYPDEAETQPTNYDAQFNNGQTDYHGSPPKSRKAKPELVLPGHHIGINDCGRVCFPILAKTHRYFVRDRTVFQFSTVNGGARLRQVEPDAFCSQLENYFTLLTFLKYYGNLELVRRPCSISDATKLLKCDPAQDFLPPIQLVTASPVFVEHDAQLIVLGKGYHSLLGGIYVSRDYKMTDIPLTQAVDTIKALAKDFLFVAESDRSRFLVALLAPALRFGGLDRYINAYGNFVLVVQAALRPTA
jgi:hypothetical protein